MRANFWLLLSTGVMLLSVGCANRGGGGGDDLTGTGPFDADGTYHEEWANDPSKWRRPGKSQAPPAHDDVLPLVAKNDEPPPNANPLAPAEPKSSSSSTSKNKKSGSSTKTGSSQTAKTKTSGSSSTSRKGKSTELSSTKKSSSSPTTRKTTASKSSKSSSSIKHVVKSNDSLWTLSRKYGSSISAIQKANGLSGSFLRDGQVLVIPKKR